MNKLMIVGAGATGMKFADLAIHCGYEDIAFLDDDERIKLCSGFSVVGDISDTYQYEDADFIVAISDSKDRELVQSLLYYKGLHIVSLIHPDAVIGKDVLIGQGTAIMAGVVINPGAVIGEGCIINAGATIDHGIRIEDYVYISVDSHLAGAIIGKGTYIGAGAKVGDGVFICNDVTIDTEAVVIHDITEPGTYERTDEIVKK